MVKDLPTNPEDTSSIPGAGRCHMLRSNKALGPQLLVGTLEPMLRNMRSLCTATRENPRTAMTVQTNNN